MAIRRAGQLVQGLASPDRYRKTTMPVWCQCTGPAFFVEEGHRVTAQQGSSVRFECPSCGGRVKVPPGQAGQTCQCPRCNARIVAPAEPGEQRESAQQPLDDDFFAEDPVKEITAPAVRSPTQPASQPKTKPPPSEETAPAVPEPAERKPQVEDKPDQLARQTNERMEFGIECGLCGTRLYATLTQVGKTLRCPDCHSKVLVKAPKKRPEPAQYREREEEGDFKLSEPIERPHLDYLPKEETPAESTDSAAGALPRQEEMSREKPAGNVVADAARQVMAKAEAEVEAAERARPVLPDQPFKTGVLSFFADAAAGVRWLALTLMGHAFVTSLRWALELAQGGGIEQFGAVFLSVVVIGLGIALALLASACSVAIIQDTANGYDKIEQWPGINVGEWMFDGFFVINSLLASAAPGVLVMCAGLSGWTAVVAGTATAVAFFPLLLLSALEQASPLGFASPKIWKSLHVGRSRWVTFYMLSAGLAVVGLMCGWLMAVENLFLTGLSCAAVTAIAMVYFRLLGRLAWCLSEAATVEKEGCRP